MKTIPSLYDIPESRKNSQILEQLNELCAIHYERCAYYRNIISAIFKSSPPFYDLQEIPFIPVRLFKELTLSSVDASIEYKTMYSSGTSDMGRSKIILDRETARLQSEVLSQIFQFEFGSQRLPMLIIDSEQVITNRLNFSARTAAVVGFSSFALRKHFALNDNFALNSNRLEEFAEKYHGQEVILFGFTFLIWQTLKKFPLINWGENFAKVSVLHGGGWKKLQNLNISNQEFKLSVSNAMNANRVIDYYGMIEQAGSIFMECPAGFFHTTAYSDILIRDPLTLEVQKFGVEGLIQLFSVLPRSYPGHSILTEDLGKVLGEDNCTCGRLGKFFQVLGRIPKAEIRGCSDVH